MVAARLGPTTRRASWPVRALVAVTVPGALLGDLYCGAPAGSYREHGPVGGLHDRGHDGQAEFGTHRDWGAAAIDPIEALEDATRVLRRDARAVVGDLQHRQPTGFTAHCRAGPT